MTTYILHGGVTLEDQQLLAAMTFWPVITDLKKFPLKVLCIYGALAANRWQIEFTRDQTRMAETVPPGSVLMVMGSAEPEVLAKQILTADIIYLRGGSTQEMLSSSFVRLENLPELFKGKIIAGTSAGAVILSAYGLSRRFGVVKGLGLLPCKVAPHYREEAAVSVEVLRQTGPDLPVYTLREYEFKVIKL